MSIQAFIDKWGPGGACHALNDRQGAQQHFIELCAVLQVDAPTGAASSPHAADDDVGWADYTPRPPR